MRYNRLLDNFTERTAPNRPSEDRGSGRTTALALHAIAVAIQRPNEWHLLKDHYGTRLSDENLMDQCKRITGELRLLHFKFNRSAGGICMICCNIWEEV